MERGKAALGLFLTLNEPTREMQREAAAAAFYETGGKKFPRLQILAAAQILDNQCRDPFPSYRGSRLIPAALLVQQAFFCEEFFCEFQPRSVAASLRQAPVVGGGLPCFPPPLGLLPSARGRISVRSRAGCRARRPRRSLSSPGAIVAPIRHSQKRNRRRRPAGGASGSLCCMSARRAAAPRQGIKTSPHLIYAVIRSHVRVVVGSAVAHRKNESADR